ncbi:hypothetical protein CLV51_102395 [Chitinophaga niastensis]|uniref:Collagen triple helix repeat protein n=1 Tax=Chitinophaga niastensis TaxID=536980 RepID=A0A2P8HMT1_CHINA|nr:hypothetical protein [Chitinophaga niastensis]PSL47538.1 hypothetical protein CLV51_102395 [Chitinophaga niastensis]
MKQFTRCMPYVLIIAVVVLFAACSKDGATGPAGAAGPDGKPGTTGPKGDSGVPGSANVIYSAWLDVKYAPAQTRTNPNGTIDTVLYIATLPALKLDSVLLGNAVVNVFFNLGTATAPNVVPLTYTDENGFLIRFVASPKLITLLANAPINTVNTTAGKRYQYRYVIIPGGVTARSANSINWKDYTQVKTYLNLQD